MKPVSTKDLNLYKDKASDEFEIGPQMALSEHLSELRKKIILSLVVFIVFALIGFTFTSQITSLLIDIAPENTMFIQIKPGEYFFASLKISFYFAVTFSSPLLIYILGSFIAPGLKKAEKKIIAPVMILSPLLFFSGILFGYYFVTPSMLNFLFGFGENIVSSSISIENFISFSLMILSICGFTFLLPVLFIVLAFFKIIDSSFLIQKWRYFILSSVVLGAVLTPTPDPFNMCLISGLLVGLYLFSFVILKLFFK